MSTFGLDDFHFLRPLWLLALLVLPLLLWLRRRARVSADPWRAVVDPPLLAAQADSRSATPRWSETLWLAGFALAVVALAGPAWRELPQPLLKLQAPLIVVLDLSASVRAADLKPDRLSRARLKLAELIRRRSDGQTALIAFAGEAFTVAPLTDDATTLDGLLSALDPSILPVPGQRPERAIRMAQRLFAASGARRGDVLLLTDRVGTAAIEAAREAAAQGLRVSALGLGTPEGAPVAVGGGGFMRDEAGNIRLPRLDESSLRALVDAGQGIYARFAGDGSDLRALGFDRAPLAVEAEYESSTADRRETLRYRDEGPVLALLLLPLAALAARRGWLLLMPLLVLPLLPLGQSQAASDPGRPRQASAEPNADHATATASEEGGVEAPGVVARLWNGLWSRPDRRAWQALQDGAAARAAELAKDPALRGSAAYRAGDLESALADFAQGDDARSHYNRGNALARLQRFEEALAAYDEALARDPGHAAAAANRQAVEDWLRRQAEQQAEQQKQDGRAGEQGTPSESTQQGEAPPEAEDSGSQDSDSGAPAEGEDRQDEPTSEDATSENQDAAGRESADVERSPDPVDADADAAQQAFNQAMQQALEQSPVQAEEAPALQPPSAEAMAEAEKRQALEQLMRRVPDDPGGLLRRKFLLEYQRRQREGDVQ